MNKTDREDVLEELSPERLYAGMVKGEEKPFGGVYPEKWWRDEIKGSVEDFKKMYLGNWDNIKEEIFKDQVQYGTAVVGIVTEDVEKGEKSETREKEFCCESLMSPEEKFMERLKAGEEILYENFEFSDPLFIDAECKGIVKYCIFIVDSGFCIDFIGGSTTFDYCTFIRKE